MSCIADDLHMVRLLVRYNGIGKPLSSDEREILLFALYNESERNGGMAADAKRECDRLWSGQQIVGGRKEPEVRP